MNVIIKRMSLPDIEGFINLFLSQSDICIDTQFDELHLQSIIRLFTRSWWNDELMNFSLACIILKLRE